MCCLWWTVWLRDAVRKSNPQKWPLLANESSVAQRLEHPIYNTEDRRFESHLGLRFFLCPLMVDSLHLPLFPLCSLFEQIVFIQPHLHLHQQILVSTFSLPPHIWLHHPQPCKCPLNHLQVQPTWSVGWCQLQASGPALVFWSLGNLDNFLALMLWFTVNKSYNHVNNK